MMHSDSPLLTDLYQLTMLQAYLDQDMQDQAAFEFFVRKLPSSRNFLVAAGLAQLEQFLLHAAFSDSDLDYLQQTGLFKRNLIDYLANFRFSGVLYAMPEGTVCFADEPMVRVVAPLPEAQLIETRLINLLQFQTLIATKAARCRLAAPTQQLVDFGLRRAHGAEAGMLAARASYLGGMDGTSNVLAGKQFGIPVLGTMAHSYIQVHATEQQAFQHFAESLPDAVVLLIDTYDTARATRTVIDLVPVLAARGIEVKAVRIDSGDLMAEARRVRNLLDQGNCGQVRIIASSSVDEYLIDKLVKQDAPIDGYGVGTSLVTSADAPYLNCAYKLQEYAGIARRKRSSGKATWPGCKQVFRVTDDSGMVQRDLLCCDDEQPGQGRPLLQSVIEHGQLLRPSPTIDSIRQTVVRNLAALPAPLRQLEPTVPFAVTVSEQLKDLADWVDHRFGK